MKLIFCPHCHEIFSLSRNVKRCKCKKSGGKYLDSLHAEIYGDSIPLGIDNKAFTRALALRPDGGMGTEFTAFVIPKSVHTIRHKEDENAVPEPDFDNEILLSFYEDVRRHRKRKRRH